jgi:hypothetical protein
MPVLRVALGEPDSFASLDHPARRLIDRMGACVMGLGGSRDLGGRLEQEIQRIVSVVEAYPDAGWRVFQTVLDEFEKFLQSFQPEKAPAASQSVSLAQQLEQRDVLAIQYSIELRKMLESVPVQELVRRFLFETWADVLATAGVTHGVASDEARHMKTVAADLIWSASAKTTREERALVLRRLPRLLKSLRAGMIAAGIESIQQDRCIKMLNDSLAAGFTAKAAAISKRQWSQLTEQLSTLEEVVSESQLLGLDESLSGDTTLAAAADLAGGVHHKSGVRRA